MFLTLPLILYAFGALAASIEKRSPTVTIANGTVLGGSNGSVEYFKGIPYAKPPVGDLRLRSPQLFDSNFGELNATETPKVCLQGTDNESEDCLTLIVIRPASLPAANLPVILFIHGGAFQGGGAEAGNDGTPLVQQSIEMGAPIIWVSIQYRLGAFGFLSGKEVAATGDTNLGLRDQRLAMEWVQANIGAFGGDPTRVTLAGFSAGSMSTFDHTIINNGEPNGLFRGVILASGSLLSAQPVDSVEAQGVYDDVVQHAGCAQSSSTLECLRVLNASTLLAASSALSYEAFHQGGNPAYIPRPDNSSSFFSLSPDAAVAEGKYAKVPVLTGDSEDEGTLFALTLSNITNNDLLIEYLSSYYPGNGQYVSGLASTYLDDFGISGSPFGTGLSNNIFGQYKRLAAILGDITFIWARRFHLQQISSHVPSWSYLSSSLYGESFLGSFHGGDAVQTFSSSTSVPAETERRYFISFVNTLDPNGLGISDPLITWPQYTATDPQLLHMNALDNCLINDTFRMQQYQYWSENISKFRL
ncbi:putative secreted lipase [Talaromyces pinophilus]|nr:putative secreted lipase [Talaromyces pinophilus]